MGIEIVLVAAALIAGATGTWSPCGFSAVETLGPEGHSGGRLLSVIGSATFLVGALAGGLLTFGALGLLGDLLGAGSEIAVLVAAVVALLAAAGELAGVRVVPQIRRQVPETWRRWMPLPLIGAGYGLLLGLGFTTFVLTFGVWALAGLTLAAGDPALGLLIGAAFGLGRAIPVVVLSPIADTDAGCRALDAMAERPSTYRAFRLANAGVLSVLALAIITTGALAKRDRSEPAFDPSAVGGALAYERPGKSAVLVSGGNKRRLPGSDPAISRSWIAVIAGERIQVLWRGDREPVGSFAAAGADAVAIDRGFVLWRSRRSGRDTMYLRRISIAPPSGGAQGGGGKRPQIKLGKQRKLDGSSRSAQLGRPSVDGSRAVWAHAKQGRNFITHADLRRGSQRTIRSSRGAALQNPSLDGRWVAYVVVKQRRQKIKLSTVGGSKSRTIESRPAGKGLIWSTDLTGKRVFATVRTKKGVRVRSYGR